MSDDSIPQDPVPEDTFNILVATDIHLGYNEKDPVRGKKQYGKFPQSFSPNFHDILILEMILKFYH